MRTPSTAENDTESAWVEVDLGALLRNAEALARHAQVPLLPMVKADAYGLGAVPVARQLSKLEPFGFGVATPKEGRELRDAGVRRPVIVFTPQLPASFSVLRQAGLTPALSDSAAINAWIESGGGSWHLGIDTGINRAGIRWDRVGDLADLLRRSPPDGAYTHFHSSELDDGTMETQEQRFREALDALPTRPPLLHAEGSGAIVRRSPSSWSFVRPGIFLYGVGSGKGAAFQPEAVVHLRARIVETHDLRVGESVGYGATWRAGRPSRVATIGVGYADGYPQRLSNRGVALVRGARTPVVGSVMMDMTVIDVTDARCGVGDVVTLLGAADDQLLTVEEVAAAGSISPYELLTGLRQRLTRRVERVAG